MTTANAMQSAGKSYEKGKGVLDIGSKGGGGAASQAQLEGHHSHRFDVRSFTHRQAANIVASNTLLPDQLIGTENGLGGGSLMVTVEDNDNNEDLSTGDTAFIQFIDYQEDSAEDDIINGSIFLDQVTVTGGFLVDFSFAARFTYDLVVREAGPNGQSDTLQLSFFATETESGDVTTTTFDCVDEEIDITVTETENEVTDEWTLDIDGEVLDEASGTWLFYLTVTPFAGIGDESESNPTSGVLEIYDDDGFVRLTALPDGLMVRIQVDADGNGSFELDEDVTWEALEAAG